MLTELPAKHLLWESKPLSEITVRFRGELSVECIVFSPCERLSKEDASAGLDYVKVMRANLKRLRDALGK